MHNYVLSEDGDMKQLILFLDLLCTKRVIFLVDRSHLGIYNLRFVAEGWPSG